MAAGATAQTKGFDSLPGHVNTYEIIYADGPTSHETIRSHRMTSGGDGYIRFRRSDSLEVLTLVARHVLSVRWVEGTNREAIAPDWGSGEPEPSDAEVERQRARFTEQYPNKP